GPGAQVRRRTAVGQRPRQLVDLRVGGHVNTLLALLFILIAGCSGAMTTIYRYRRTPGNRALLVTSLVALIVALGVILPNRGSSVQPTISGERVGTVAR